MSYCRWPLRASLLLSIGGLLACHVWAHVQYRHAQSALARRDLPQAQMYLDRCLRIWFSSADTYLLAARTARRAGDFNQAMAYLRKCRAFGGADEAIDLEYKLLRVQQGALREVEEFLVSLMTRGHPETPAIAEVLTLAFMKSYQLQNAAECVRRWLEREPDRIEAWRCRAHLYTYAHNRQEVLASYRRLVELDPENDQDRLLLAGELIQEHQPQQALDQFEYLRGRLGDTPQVLGGLACCQRELNHAEEARQLLDRVLTQEPQNSWALGERARLALQYESAAEAEKWLRRAVVQSPGEPHLLYSLIQCLERLGKRSEAQEVQVRLRRTEAELHRLDEVTRQIARSPHNADLRCEAGLIMLRNGQEAEGLRWLASALEEDPDHAATHQALADCLEHAGDKEAAAQHRLKGMLPGKP